MKSSVLVFAWLSLVAAASTAVGCAGSTPPAENPENADESASSDKSDTPARAPSQSKVTVKDDDKTDTVKCAGFDIPDLAALLAQPSCELPDGSSEPKERDVKDDLEIKVSADGLIAPGSRSNVRVLFKNKGKADLPLDFVVDPEAHFSFEVYTPKGTRVDKPSGDEPSLPESVSNAPVPDKKYARVTIAANGTAGLTLPWEAVKMKWVSKDKAKGAVPGRGYPVEPGGPLPKGKYVLRVITPLVGVFEGVDHEVTQPRTDVTIGGR